MSDNLAPCPLPWCGKPAVLWRDHEGVRCSDDNCILWDADIPPKDWNRRTGIEGMVPEGAWLQSVEAVDGGLWQAMVACANGRTRSVRDVYGTGATPEEAVADAVRGITE